MGGLDDGRVAREAEVVVRAQVEQLATAFHVDVRALWSRHHELRLVEPGLPHLGEAGREIFAQRSVHDAS